MAKTVKDVKDKILDYLYDLDFEKMTVAEMNTLGNVTMVLKSVSEIKESTDDPYAKALMSIYDKSFSTLHNFGGDNSVVDTKKEGE